ncbi:MAG TPA: acyl-CoA dehydrogenase family protein, partial [Stellaceae bacterium]|nr:acyl-CoA dehydrogenase family protein [Stellaceae bacterium]
MTDNIIVDTATRIFADLCEPATVNAAEEGTWPKALWDALEESGLTLTWVPDTLGGAGAELLDGFAVLRAAGRANAPVPLAETLMAGWLLAQAGLDAPAGPLTIAPIHADGRIELANGTLRGRARQVPFARNAGHIVVLAGQNGGASVALVPASAVTIGAATSLAGEPRDTVSFDGASATAVSPAAGLDMAGIMQFGAAVRAQQMAGALEHILDQSVQWSLDRVQFGRPIAKFQAVQHNLAQLAGEVAAAGAAADGASQAIANYRVGNETT